MELSLISLIKKNHKTKRIKICQINTLTYFLILYSFMIFYYLILGNKTAFEWTTTQDIPFILRLINDDFLSKDFYTNSIVGSPRFFFSYIIYSITLLGIDWYPILFFFKIFILLLKLPLLFLTTFRIFLAWKPKNISTQNLNLIKFLFFLGSLGLFSVIQGHNSFWGPFGWGAIQTFNNFSPMTLSFFIGLIYNFLSFDDSRLKYISPLFLFISIIIHPTIGLCHFAISMIFLLPKLSKKQLFFKLGLDTFLGVLIPVSLLIYFFLGKVNLEPSIFIHYYINIRHPDHYLMSKAISLQSFKWVILFGIPLFYSYKIKDKKYFLLSSFIFASFIGAPILQFIGTEVFHIKEIAQLGPSRFTTYTSILWGLNIIIIGSVFFLAQVGEYDRKYFNLSTLILTSFIGFHLLHFFGVEIFQMEGIQLGRSYSITYTSILWGVNIIIICFGFFLIRVERYNKWLNFIANFTLIPIILNIVLIIQNFLLLIQSLLKKNITIICLFTFGLIGSFYLTYKHPLDFYERQDVKSLIKWVSKNTPEHSVFFVRKFNTFLIRVYGKRSILADTAFSFNENNIKEETERFFMLKNSSSFKPSDYACLNKFYPLDYLIIPLEEKFNNLIPLFSSRKWLVYDVNTFKTKLPCQKKFFFNE